MVGRLQENGFSGQYKTEQQQFIPIFFSVSAYNYDFFANFAAK